MRKKNKRSTRREDFDGTGIYIYGNKELIIDGKCSLVLYEDSRIVLRCARKHATLAINGSSLKLCTTGNHGICIKGNIGSLEFGEGI